MHILFLTDNFPPETNAPANRTFEHCLEWVKSGHSVTIVTCAPNFPNGAVYEGYRNKIWQSEIIKGIKVIRVWTYIAANKGFTKRIIDYLSYMFSASIASIFVRKVDLVIGTSPQFFTAIGAYLVALLKFKPFVFELRDLWPESVKGVGAMSNSKLIKLLEIIEIFLYKRAKLIISVTHSFKDILIERGVDGNKIKVITNGSNTSLFFHQEKRIDLLHKYKLENKFVVGYIGTLGMAHSLNTILEAAYIINNKKDNKDIHFIFLGEGADKENLKKMSELMGLKNVTFINNVSREEVANYWTILDVSVIHLKKMPVFKSVIPSKIFESMAMGIPIIHGVEGESANIVIENKVGEVFEPENSNDFINKLESIKSDLDKINNMRHNCIINAIKYDRKNLAKEMLSILEDMDRALLN